MKKFKTMLCAAAAAIFGLGANAQETAQVNFTLDIDDASHVTVYVDNTPLTDITSGENAMTVNEYANFYIVGVSPWAVQSVTYGEIPGYIYQGSWSTAISPSDFEGKTVKVTTFNPDEARTAAFTVKVDNASMVQFMRMSDGSTITLTDGENTVKFNPETETTYMVGPTNYSVPLYEVKVNDQVQTPTSYYRITIAEGDVVEITAVIPPTPVTCSFSFNEGAEDAISSVLVNEEPAEIVDGKIDMMAGQKLTINFSSFYGLDKFMVGEEDMTTRIYGMQYNSTIMADTKFTIEAHAYATIKATVKISDPAAIMLCRGNDSKNEANAIALTGEETEIEMPEGNSTISWSVNAGYLLTSVEVNGTALNSYETNYIVKADDVITFNVEKLVLDKKAQFWINNREAAKTYFELADNDKNSYSIATGYNEIEFCASMAPFGLSWYDQNITECSVYINNTEVTHNYPDHFNPNSGNYTLNITDGDVVKVFLNEKPVECNVTFTAADGCSAQVIADHMVAIEDLTAAYTCFNGTELTITPAEGTIVKVGENSVDPVDGVCTLTVTEPATAISLEADPKMGISEISAAANSAAAAYDLQGRRVVRPAKGLFIINGKKVLVK